jgi:hypothetical protein
VGDFDDRALSVSVDEEIGTAVDQKGASVFAKP